MEEFYVKNVWLLNDLNCWKDQIYIDTIKFDYIENFYTKKICICIVIFILNKFYYMNDEGFIFKIQKDVFRKTIKKSY